MAGRRLPTAWRLEIPGFGLTVDTGAANAQCWMGTACRWAGPVRIAGSHEGRGYLEMTGH